MIIDKIVKVKIGSHNFKWYLSKGYGPFRKNDIITIKIEDLTLGASTRINVKCDFCNIDNNVQYNNYNNQIKKSFDNIYSCKKCKDKKTQITNLQKYGVKYIMKNEDMIEKSKKTCFKNYGVNNISKLDSIKNNRKEYMSNDNFKNKSKITWLNKYGVDNPSKNEEIKNMKKKTCFKNWGVEYPSQSPELFEKSQKTGKTIKLHNESGLWYRGTYELDFLNFCHVNNIDVQKGPTICYIFNNKKSYYHSDFYLSKYNLICEIKSNYYYDKFLERNLLKEKFTKEKGYSFIFIINKKYDEFIKLFISKI